MTYTLTQQLSHDEMWVSLDPTRTEEEDGYSQIVFTPIGMDSLRSMG